MAQLQPLKICIVGCGRVAKSHLKGAAEVPDRVNITALVSRNRDKADEFCREYGVKETYATMDEAFEDGDFDAVDLCLPNPLASGCRGIVRPGGQTYIGGEANG